jgi:hypothetical protein
MMHKSFEMLDGAWCYNNNAHVNQFWVSFCSLTLACDVCSLKESFPGHFLICFFENQLRREHGC